MMTDQGSWVATLHSIGLVIFALISIVDLGYSVLEKLARCFKSRSPPYPRSQSLVIAFSSFWLMKYLDSTMFA